MCVWVIRVLHKRVHRCAVAHLGILRGAQEGAGVRAAHVHDHGAFRAVRRGSM